MISTASEPNQTNSTPSSAPEPHQVASNGAPSSADDRLSTIRNLLVGDQIDALNDRFSHLESSLQAHSNQLVDQIKSKFDAAYTLYKVELDEMGDKVAGLQNDHHKTGTDLQHVTDRLTAMEKKHDDLKSELSHQLSELYDEFSKNVNEFTSVMKSQYDELSTRMVTKTDLANLFGNLSAAAVGNSPNSENRPHS
jgi:chromosome segregation ATPase